MIADHSLIIVVLAAIAAGLLNAFVGGGALLTVPTLILLGLPPINALACVRTGDVFSSTSNAVAYWRRGIKPDKYALQLIVPMVLGAIIGNSILQNLPDNTLRVLIPILLLLAAGYFAFAPNIDDVERGARIKKYTMAAMFFCLGLYHGLFGVGVAIFMTIALHRYGGYGVTRAVGVGKTITIPVNVAMFLSFLIGGHIIWPVAIACIIGILIGTQIGAHIAIKGGAKIIRPVAAITCAALSLKLLFFS